MAELYHLAGRKTLKSRGCGRFDHIRQRAAPTAYFLDFLVNQCFRQHRDGTLSRQRRDLEEMACCPDKSRPVKMWMLFEIGLEGLIPIWKAGRIAGDSGGLR
jgi:hypothetical protein